MILFESILNKVLKLVNFIYHRWTPKYLKEIVLYFHSYRLFSAGNVIDGCYENYKKKIINNPNDITIEKKQIYFLHQIFNKLSVRSNLIDNEFWKNYILLSKLFDEKKYNELNINLISQVKNSNLNSLEYWEILRIYSFSIRIGLFELAYILRGRALEKALAYPLNLENFKTWKLKARLSALLETEKFDEFDKIFPILKRRDQNEKYFKYFPIVRSWWTKEEKSLSYLRDIFLKQYQRNNKEILNNIDTNQDLIFRKFIEKKKISIVGPSYSDSNDDKKINEADIVIRVNYTQEQKNAENFTDKIRCDINYINSARIMNVLKNKNSLVFPDGSWIISKTRLDTKKILHKYGLKNNKSINFRSIKLMNLGLLSGNLMAIPNIVLDLARFDPAEVTVFHADLYLTKKSKKNYSLYTENKHHELVKGAFAKNHDPITQYNFLKFFWKNKFIKGDDRFEKIMNMGIENYMFEFKKSFRKLSIDK